MSALIVGGGPAGAAAAIGLARAGLPHLLIERTRKTGDALCGGFLSWRTLEVLTRLGLDPVTLNPAPTPRTRLFAGAHMAEALLPRPALSVSRRKLDHAMLKLAEAAGAQIERGVTVRSIEARPDGGYSARLHDGADISATALLLASGKHEVRGLARPATARGSDPTLGLRIRLAASASLAALIGDAVELHLFAGGYCGVALQEDGSANLCMAVHRSRLDEAGDPAMLLAALGAECPHLGERLAWRSGSEPIDAVANVPYGWWQRDGAPALFRLGDQAGVIPSLAGEGMGIALASGESASRALIAGGSGAAADWQGNFAKRVERPIRLADTIRAVAERPLGARTLVYTARAIPPLTRIAARLTRLPPD